MFSKLSVLLGLVCCCFHLFENAKLPRKLGKHNSFQEFTKLFILLNLIKNSYKETEKTAEMNQKILNKFLM